MKIQITNIEAGYKKATINGKEHRVEKEGCGDWALYIDNKIAFWLGSKASQIKQNISNLISNNHFNA